jgi:hypothetical protein
MPALRTKLGPGITSSMLAHAFLVVTSRAMRPAPPQVITDENADELIPLTAAETRRLFNLGTCITRPQAYH